MNLSIDPIKAAVAPYMLLIKLGLAVVLAAGLFVSGCNHGADKWQTKYEDEARAREHDNIEWETIVDGLAERTKQAEARAKAAGEQAKADRLANDERYKDARHEADEAKRALRDHLRAGTVRLRDEFTCPAARPAQGGATTAAGRQDAAPDLRREREAAISDDIAEADAADRWIIWLQTELTSTRTACGDVP